MDPIYARKNWGLLEEQRTRARRMEQEDGPAAGEPTPGEVDPRLAGGAVPQTGRG